MYSSAADLMNVWLADVAVWPVLRDGSAATDFAVPPRRHPQIMEKLAQAAWTFNCSVKVILAFLH
jgi:hypothetical protein